MNEQNRSSTTKKLDNSIKIDQMENQMDNTSPNNENTDWSGTLFDHSSNENLQDEIESRDIIEDQIDPDSAADDEYEDEDGEYDSTSDAFDDFVAMIKDLAPIQQFVADKAVGKILDLVSEQKRLYENMREHIDQMHLDMSYLLFDLEATRKERDEYYLKLKGLGRWFN